MSANLKTTIDKDGQRYVDEPITVKPKPKARLELAIETALDPRAPFRQPLPIVVGHERVRLRWMTPDGKGGLKPREGQ